MTHYLVLGAGMQGTAAVYDLALRGQATALTWIDSSSERLEAGLRRIAELVKFQGLRGQVIDANDRRAMQPLFTEADVCLNALPYRFAPSLTLLALEGRCHYLDLGGNTAVVQEQLELHRGHPNAKHLCVLPDCGLMPGMGNLFVALAVAELGDCSEVAVRCGGLPQDPKPPLDYMLVFSVAGLLNEYFGRAQVLREGRVVEVPTFTELEQLEFDRIGAVEAFVTSGGLSTTPWTFEGRIDRLDYKTVRYPGHHGKFKLLLELGLLDEDPVQFAGANQVVPRALLSGLLQKRLHFHGDRDLVVLRCSAKAKEGGRTLEIEVYDAFDEHTGFTAMERTTAWSATACAVAVATGEVAPGPRPLEQAMDPHSYLRALRLRGFEIQVTDSNDRSED
ncbi:saccharopine dehydrogenase family protein [Engelhardtia mirabilis]|uniref:Lysine 6-dehydrogenase n=1 Tax=Engelhardtia mirabilis TaxID=2528011 RepID=A0A518BNS3_9BACT|nr:Lysine 6-dehydrogenase [Planctomycetes bacterium Pla133]QDV02921.1 Lysine 6-dehydrogenase [Planctomycetes bacterium Pla86]